MARRGVSIWLANRIGVMSWQTGVAFIAFLLVTYVVLPILILWLRDWVENAWYKWQNPPEEISSDRVLYEQRILRPDWQFYERHLQRRVPMALRDLYGDRELVTAQGLDYS